MVTGYMSLLSGRTEPGPPSSTLEEIPDVGYMTALGGQRVGPEWQGGSIEDDDGGSGLLTPITEFQKGLWSSLTSGNINMLGGAAEAFEVATGSDPTKTLGRETQDWINDPSRQTALPKTWAESKGVTGVMGYLSGLTGQAVGSMAAPMAAGAVGGAAGSLVAPGVGTTIGAVGGAFSVGAMLNIGETYLQLRDEGVDPSEASKYAIAIGSGIGVIDTVGLGRVLGATALKQVKKKAISELASQAARGYLRGAAEEGITETVQAGIRETLAGALTDNPNLQERALNALHEGFAGALGGGAIGGAGRATRAAMARRPTLAERRSSEGAVPSELLKGDGLDDMVKDGFKATKGLLGDDESNASLEKMGLPAVGSDVTFRGREQNQKYRVKGFIPQDKKGPDALLVEDDQKIENQIDLPLRDEESLMMTEDFQREQDSEQFIKEANELAPPGQPQGLETLMREEGFKTLGAIPEESRKDFLGKMKTRFDDQQKQAEEEQRSSDENMVFGTQMETIKDSFSEVPNFDAIDSSVREQMGLQPEEEVPEARRKPYLAAMKMRLQAAAKKVEKPVEKPEEGGEQVGVQPEEGGEQSQVQDIDTTTEGFQEEYSSGTG